MRQRVLNIQQLGKLNTAINNGYFLSEKKRDMPLIAMYSDWCQANKYPNVVIRQGRRYAVVRLDMLTMMGHNLTEESLNVIKDLVRFYYENNQDIRRSHGYNSAIGTYTYLYVKREHANDVAKKLLDIVLNDENVKKYRGDLIISNKFQRNMNEYMISGLEVKV